MRINRQTYKRRLKLYPAITDGVGNILLFIRVHQFYTVHAMRPIVTDVACSVVCVCRAHGELCRNG